MRRIPIQGVNQSGSNPGSFIAGLTTDNPTGNWVSVFRGKYYRPVPPTVGTEKEFYEEPSTPVGYALIPATTFTVVDNPSYAGRYTVYTKPSAAGLSSSTFNATETTVRVNEPLAAPLSLADLTRGYITNVSTYYIAVPPSSPIIVPPETLIEDAAFDLPGRNFSGWGEVFLQNLARQTQNFAGGVPPGNPLVGQPWFNTTNGEFRIWNGTAWNLTNSTAFAPASSFRHTQSVAASTWTVNHNLGVASPFIVHASFFVDTGGGVIKPILPSDMTYVSANQFTVTFSTNYTGYALVRA